MTPQVGDRYVVAGEEYWVLAVWKECAWCHTSWSTNPITYEFREMSGWELTTPPQEPRPARTTTTRRRAADRAAIARLRGLKTLS